MTKYYTIYQITNLINQKIYIGHHTTFNLDDKYMGSGKQIGKAIEEFGVENFKKEILFIFDNKEEMINKESEIGTDEFRKREDTYNLALGGGGWGMSGIKLSPETCKKMSESRTGKKRTFSKTHRENLSRAQKNRRKETPEETERRIAPLRGRKKAPHSDETKKRISDGNKGRILTVEHREKISESGKGRIWISNIELNKTTFVKFDQLEQFLNEGWIIGRSGSPIKQETKDKISQSNKGKSKSKYTNRRRNSSFKLSIINSIISSLISSKETNS